MGELDKNNGTAPAEVPTEPTLEVPDMQDDSETSIEAGDSQMTEEPEPVAENAAPGRETGVPAARDNRFAWLRHLVRSRRFKIAAPIVVVALVALCALVAPVRYLLLNLVSSTSAEVVVVDDETLAPVQGALVTVGGHRAQTNAKGHALLHSVAYGSNAYSVTKEAYDSSEATVTLGSGSTLIGPVKLHSSGVAVMFKAVNTLSKQPLKDFTVRISGSNVSATANANGLASLKVPASRLGAQHFTLGAKGFNDTVQAAAVSAHPSTTPLTVALTPEGRHYFLSNRSGKVDVYSSNLDGTDAKVVIAGTGAEGASTQMVVSPDAKHAALISKRDKQAAADGSINDALYLVDFTQKTLKRLDDGVPNMHAIGWSDNSHIAYSIDYNDYNNPASFKFKLATTNGQLSTLYSDHWQPTYNFNQEDPGHLYFIQYATSAEDYGINSIDLVSKKSQRLVKSPPEDGNLLHAQPYTLAFKVNGIWSSINTKTQHVQSASRPTRPDTNYVPSPDNTKVAWTENRDGKSSLILANQDLSGERMVTQNPVVSTILTWSSKDYIVYTSVSINSSGDYIVYLPTGQVTKIADVFLGSSSYYGHE